MTSGDLFGLTQNAGMGWDPAKMSGQQFLILSTQGGLRDPQGDPVALGYHTGHWEVGLLMEEAAKVMSAHGAVPFAAYVSDPCDGRTQGTAGMFDSLPYRNDAAMVLRRLIRSLPTRRGVMGVATCDKGLPAMLMALAGSPDLPGILVPGGVTLLAEEAEDTAKVQTLATRFAHQEITLDHAAEMGCKVHGHRSVDAGRRGGDGTGVAACGAQSLRCGDLARYGEAIGLGVDGAGTKGDIDA
jgi:dihydroxyacid dehydratase/phosphogluconate dehydratase